MMCAFALVTQFVNLSYTGREWFAPSFSSRNFSTLSWCPYLFKSVRKCVTKTVKQSNKPIMNERMNEYMISTEFYYERKVVSVCVKIWGAENYNRELIVTML